MAQPDHYEVLKDLHEDLVRKYRLHGAKVAEIWRSFDKAQRSRAMKAGAKDGVVLRHRRDPLLPGAARLSPEWNLQDITEPGSDFLLDLLRHRATTSLIDQYAKGMDETALGDYAFISEMVRTKGLRYPEPFKDCWSLFFDEEMYGKAFKINADRDGFLSEMAPVIQNGTCVPQNTGELILTRQINLAQSLIVMMDDILDIGSTTRTRKERPQGRDETSITAALEKMAVRPKPTKLSISDLIASSAEQRDSTAESLSLLCTEPVILAHVLNLWFYSRPELVADEKGRMLPVHTDKYISAALFDAVHHAVKAAAIWNYTTRLLELLQHTTDKVYRAVILQEISNTCHLEYARTQSLLKRHIQSASGAKYFKRMAGPTGSGSARVVMKIKPDSLTRQDPQLHYLLRLCQTETTASKAPEWLDKLAALQKSYTTERERLEEREFEAMCDTAAIVALMQDLAPGISMPPLSRNKGQLFVSRTKDLETELTELKGGLDLMDFLVPIDNLLEPGMAENALKALDDFVVENAGSNLGFLYQDLIEDCFDDLTKQYQQIKTKAEKVQTEFTPVPQQAAESSQTRVEQRREKQKTRPAHRSLYEIAPPAPEAHENDDNSAPLEKTQVKASTFNVFSTLFSKAEARGSVSWAAFEAAMADLGFSVIPKFGSVFTFLPPQSMKASRSFTVHRPHKSNIEGWRVPVFSRRLKRVYGWDENTFEMM
ncbi:hypothetical protein diail_12068 [Diaporthe ilicicola]|nr:hypothetical protein diail_12068 [Diaporthe ilicicola]